LRQTGAKDQPQLKPDEQQLPAPADEELPEVELTLEMSFSTSSPLQPGHSIFVS